MNPFRELIVANPWETTRVDVREIHGGVFDQCLKGIAHVRESRHSAGLLIHGESGSGKTHLLSRLREWLAPQAPSATDRPECLFVWVRLQTTPRMIWRTLRRTLVDDWFRPVSGGHSQFKRILFHRLAEKRPAEGDLERWYEYMLDEHPEGLAELMDEIATDIDLDRNTAVAFTHIAFDRHQRDLRAWLAGTSLPQAALDRMDLAQDEGNDEEREDQARQVVLMLCRLAGNGLPIVLSFDQVEALQTVPRELEPLYSFGQMISSLHDGATTNVLLVSCVQSTFATELKSNAREADYFRMTSLGALSLDPLSRADAERLIAARRAANGAAGDSDVRDSRCWPLSQDEFDALFANGSVSPRRLLAACAERFESRSRAASPAPAVQPSIPRPRGTAETVPAFLEEKWDATLGEKLAASTPESTEEIVRHGLPLLVRLAAGDVKQVRDPQLPDVSLIFEAPRGRSGLSVCNQSNMTSLAARLKRLKAQLGLKRLDRLVLLRDTRVPISPTAKMAQQYLAELEREQAAVVYPSVEVLAALDALRELLSDAKSGDLSCSGEAIRLESVEEWLTKHLSSQLVDLVDDVLGTTSGDSPKASDTSAIEALNELLAHRPMLPLAEAARSLGRRVDEVADIAQRHPHHFGLLGEPPETLFRPVRSPQTSG